MTAARAPPTWAVLMLMLMLTVSDSRRGCDYSGVVSTYQALVLVELHSLNLAGPFNISRGKDHCPSEKAPKILQSIYRMTQLSGCRSNGPPRGLRGALERMSELIRLRCPRVARRHADNRDPHWIVMDWSSSIFMDNCQKTEKTVLQRKTMERRRRAGDGESDGLLAAADERLRLRLITP